MLQCLLSALLSLPHHMTPGGLRLIVYVEDQKSEAAGLQVALERTAFLRFGQGILILNMLLLEQVY